MSGPSRSSEPSVDREVVCGDALAWLRETPFVPDASYFASLPDYSEFPGRTLAEWKDWFRATARLVIERTPPNGVALFFQSDIRHEGEWVDKAYLCQRAAEDAGVKLLFHKIFCRAAPGIPTFGRPGYSHLLAFSRDLRPDLARSTADVLEDVGGKTWTRGTGFAAAHAACRFVAEHTDSRALVNPFCGEGGILAVANRWGLRAVGIERSPKRAAKARAIALSPDGRGWAGP